MDSSAAREVPRVLLVKAADWTLRAARSSLTAPDATNLAVPANPQVAGMAGEGRAADSAVNGLADPSDDVVPLIVLDRGRVLACCELAAAEGVVVGLRVREAQLRCPLATIVQHDPRLEAEAFNAVVELIEQVVPEVHVVRPGVAAVRVRGAARFYGGEQQAAEVVWGALESHGFDMCIGVADGLFAAEQAASLGERVHVVPAGDSPRFLAGLEVGVLADEDLVRTLRQLGLRRLGQFAALTPRQVTSRFGAGARAVHERVRGFDTDPLRPRVAQRSHATGISFDEPVLLAQQVVASACDVVQQLVADLTAAGLVCTEVCIMVRTGVGVSERVWRHPWQFRASDLSSRLAWQLDEISFESSDEAGVHAVQFIPTTHAADDHAEGLFGDRPTEHLMHILTTMQDERGPASVLTPALNGSRVLRDRCVLTPFGSVPPSAAQRRTDQPWPGRLAGPAPGVVLPTPRQVMLQGEGGEPVRVVDGELASDPSWFATARGHRARVIAWAGPWPVRQRWWGDSPTGFNRVQLVTEDQHAWLLAGDADVWWLEASYD